MRNVVLQETLKCSLQWIQHHLGFAFQFATLLLQNSVERVLSSNIDMEKETTLA